MTSDRVPTWEEVARDHGQFLFTVAYRLTGNVDDARDLVQEALLRVRRGLATYEPGSLEGWLARIVTNVFLDDMRRKKRRPVQALPEEPDLVVPPAVAADVAADASGLSTEIQAAIAALPEEFRVPVVLCDVADQSYDDIARTLGVPIGTVRSRLHRGRKLLRDEPDDDVFSAYLDDELTSEARAGLEARLAADSQARDELDAISEVRTLVRGLAPPVLPEGFVDQLLAAPDHDADATGPAAPVTDLATARATHRRPARFAAVVASVAAAIALIVAVAVPNRTASNPALATDVRVHQAGSAAAGDPVSGLAPLATSVRFGR
jgi:RNA polymerase sigma factor (sigma-70 family)